MEMEINDKKEILDKINKEAQKAVREECELKACEFCGRRAELEQYGEVRICFLCKLNQKARPRGKEIKERTTCLKPHGKTVYGENKLFISDD